MDIRPWTSLAVGVAFCMVLAPWVPVTPAAEAQTTETQPSTETPPSAPPEVAPHPGQAAEPDTDTDVDRDVREFRNSAEEDKVAAGEFARKILDGLKSSYATLESKTKEASTEMRDGRAANKDTFELLSDQARLRLKDLDEAAASGWESAKSDTADALQRMSEWLKGRDKSAPAPAPEAEGKPNPSEQKL